MSDQPSILIVEDQKKVARLLSAYFLAEDFKVDVLHHGDQVISSVIENRPDIILLDIMLPGLDGVTICRHIRKIDTIPIIMITARVDETSILEGLETGADDYICKPFSPKQVVARVKTVLRRCGYDKAKAPRQVGLFSVQSDVRDVSIGSKLLNLTPVEFGILSIMMNRPNTIFSRQELLSMVQGYEHGGYERTIDTHIKNLRKKIASALPNQQVIVSVYGAGYKFCPE